MPWFHILHSRTSQFLAHVAKNLILDNDKGARDSANAAPHRQRAEHMRSSRVFLRVSGGLAVLLLYCSPLLANSISYTLNTPNSQLSSSPGPYGTVGLSLNANGSISVLVTMTNMFGTGATYGIAGGGPAFGFNGPVGITISALTFGFSCCQPSGSGYGGFRYVIGGPPPGGHAPTSLSFIVAVPGGFTSVNQLGNNFMAHVIPPNGNATGYATVTVPDGDPSTLILLLLGFGTSGLASIALRSRVGKY